MGFQPVGGITRLSELEIDVSKDWAAKQIKNVLDPTLDQDTATKKYHDDNPGGISKLSELEIDADKSWLLYALSRLGGLDVGQVRGDIWIYDYEDHANLIVRRLAAAETGKILTSRGPGLPPFWAWLWEEPGGTISLERFFPALIDLTYDVGIVTVDRSHNENAPLTSEHEQSYLDAPADYIKRLTPAILVPDAEAVVAVDRSYNKNAPLTSSYTTAVA